MISSGIKIEYHSFITFLLFPLKNTVLLSVSLLNVIKQNDIQKNDKKQNDVFFYAILQSQFTYTNCFCVILPNVISTACHSAECHSA
jgi:hypothetical protein